MVQNEDLETMDFTAEADVAAAFSTLRSPTLDLSARAGGGVFLSQAAASLSRLERLDLHFGEATEALPPLLLATGGGGSGGGALPALTQLDLCCMGTAGFVFPEPLLERVTSRSRCSSARRRSPCRSRCRLSGDVAHLSLDARRSPCRSSRAPRSSLRAA